MELSYAGVIGSAEPTRERRGQEMARGALAKLFEKPLGNLFKVVTSSQAKPSLHLYSSQGVGPSNTPQSPLSFTSFSGAQR